MIISDSKNFVFVHVQKTAGSSIRRALLPYALDYPRTRAYKLLTRSRIIRNWRRYAFRHHAPLRDAERILPAERFSGMFKFGFVRNPWDRLVSWYSFYRQRPHHKRHDLVHRLGSFEAYVEFEIRRDKTSQFRMLADSSGGVNLDFVGHFESLHDDFAEVCRRLDVEAELPVHNLTRHDSYRNYYTDELAERVAEHWRKDVETFGYEF
ncbi:MAG: sulfotransferase family protein [bacterium]|nr:sulfotransferase family protein [bacterium]